MKRLTVFAGQLFNGGLRSLLLVCLVGLMSWLAAVNQPAYAAKADASIAPTRELPTPDRRGNLYDESMKVVDPPRGEKKIIKENIRKSLQFEQGQAYDEGAQSAQEGNTGLVERVKELADGFTPGGN